MCLQLLDLDDDVLLAIMQTLRVKLVRGKLLLVCHRLLKLASSSAALGCHVDLAFLGGAKNRAITPILEELAKLNRDGLITSVKLGNHSWGSTTTKKLTKLFPALESVDLGTAKKVARGHGLLDWSVAAVPHLRSFKWCWAFDCHDPMVMNLVRGRVLLEELHLTHCEGDGGHSTSTGLTDDLLIVIGTSCPKLRKLQLQGHLMITSKGVEALLKGCPALSTLTLSTSTIYHKLPDQSFARVTDECRDAIEARGIQLTLTSEQITKPTYRLGVD